MLDDNNDDDDTVGDTVDDDVGDDDDSDRDNDYGGNHNYKRYNLYGLLTILLSSQPTSIYLYVYRLNDFLRFSFDLNSDDMEHVPSTLISELKEYVNNDLLSDVSFIVEGKNNDR